MNFENKGNNDLVLQDNSFPANKINNKSFAQCSEIVWIVSPDLPDRCLPPWIDKNYAHSRVSVVWPNVTLGAIPENVYAARTNSNCYEMDDGALAFSIKGSHTEVAQSLKFWFLLKKWYPRYGFLAVL